MKSIVKVYYAHSSMSASDSRSVTVLPGTSQETPHGKGTVLPPLTSQYPQWSRGGKLEIGVYKKPFSSGNEKGLQRTTENKVNKKGPELAAIGRSEGLMVTPTSDPLLRIAQLEQNIRFLQEQHQIMLASLHQEVDQLRQRNRDLQFQLVFTKGGVTLVQSSPSPSSPEDDSKPKIILSPKQVNMTPLQVELLEKEVAELKNSLSEARTKNLYLSGIVEEQKKKIDSLEHGKQELEAVGSKIGPNAKTDAQNQAGSNSKNVTATEGTEADLTFKLEEAERVIRRLRRDNEEHRRELVTIKSNLSKSLTGAGGNRQLGGGGNNSHRGNGGAGGGNSHHRPHNQQQSQTQRFPPLHTQSYWHHGQHSQHRTGMEFVSHRHCANGGGSSGGGNGGGGGGSRLEKETQVVGRPAPSLPNLRNNSTSSGYTFSNGNGNNNGSNHRRGGGHYNGNGNHYYRSGNKGGGGRANRESRDRGDGK